MLNKRYKILLLVLTMVISTFASGLSFVDYEGNDSYTYKHSSGSSSIWYFDEDEEESSSPTDYWVEFTVSGDELSFETNNVSLDLLSIKGGNYYRVYTDLGDSESGLTAPINEANDKPYEISHYSFELTIVPVEEPWEGMVRVIKTIDGDGDLSLQGIEFMLEGPDDYEEIKSTDVNGEVEFTGLMEGAYTLTEEDLEGFTSSLPDDGLVIDLPDDADEYDVFEVDVTNTPEDEPWEGSIEINKSFVGDGEYDLDNIEFTLTGPDDYEEIKSTDVNGEVEFTGLMEGAYTLTEEDLEGFTSSLPDDGLVIDLPDDADEYDVFEVDVVNSEVSDEDLGSLTVHKRIMKDKGNIVGALGDGEFTVTLEGPIGEDGSTVREKTINGPDEKGEHVIFNNLPFGTYILMETEIVHEGVTYGDPIYATSGNQNYDLVDNENIIIGSDGTEQVWVINVPEEEEEPWEGKIIVEKTFRGQGQYVSFGIEFTLTGPDEFEETEETDSDGIVEFTGLLEGTYILTEEDMEGFTTSIPKGGLEIVLPEDADEDDVFEVEVINTEIPEDWEGDIRVFKSFVGDDDSDLEGIEFTLTGPDEFEETEETDESGEVEFNNLPAGDYVLTENTPEGYRSSLGEDGMEISLPEDIDGEENDGYLFVYVTNRPIPEDWEGSIRIEKSVRDSRDNDPELDGFTFRLYKFDGDDEDLVGTRTTGSSGIVSFIGLDEGDYILYEDNRSNYTEGIDSDGLEITLPSDDAEDDILTIEVENIRRYQPRDDDDERDRPSRRTTDDDDDDEDVTVVESETVTLEPVPQAPPVVVVEQQPEPEPELEPEVEVVVAEESTPLAALPRTGASDPTVFAGLGAALMGLGLLLNRKRR